MWKWFTNWLADRREKRSDGQAHMTFGKTSLGARMATSTRLMLKKQLWIWPVVAVALLVAIGYAITSSIQHTMEANLRAQLQTLLNVERAMIEKWLDQQESSALTLANDQQIRQVVAQLIDDELLELEGKTTVETQSAKNAIANRLAKELGPGLSAYHFSGYRIANKKKEIIASNHPELIGKVVPQYDSFLTRTLEDHTTVSAPFVSVAIFQDSAGNLQTGVPVMFACAPIRDDNFQVVAALCLRIAPEREFTQLIQQGQIGRTGETFAFDREGLLVSSSRFDEELVLLGLIPDEKNTDSILKVHLRDPGGDMTRGFRPSVRRSELPLTKMSASATTGTSGVDLTGYRDFKGVPVVGAWTWLEDYSFGLAIEMQYAEAFGPLNILKRAFYILYALLTISAVAIFIFTVIVTRLQREARKAAIEARQLGQYRLEERLGEGAMGIVYKGHHAMLRRPSAIKLLNADRVNESSIQRFEREVQITCNLNNPHTIAIYDYGRTPEGVFYYAMEYLDGIDLQSLVEKYGPQPEGRVALIINQLCSSLYEAHSIGLVHRDIKPANIMLNRRGGEPDFIKLLDFGLVKAVDDEKMSRQETGMAGTPLYMSPESIQTPDLVDGRSDLYAVGAVGYFLLTGEPVFQAKSLVELCQQHVDAQPVPPSQKLNRPISQELEHAILACLEKNRAKRPQTARDLSSMIHKICTSDAWTVNDADAWWSRHERHVRSSGGNSSPDSQSGSPQVNQGGNTLDLGSQPSQPNARTAASAFDRTIDSDSNNANS